MNNDATRRPRRPRRWRTIVLAVLALLIALASAAGLYVYLNLRPPAPGKPVRFAIPPGTGTMEISQLLAANGMIRDSNLFLAYLRYSGQGTQFKAGEYEMTPGTALDRIVAQLNKGETVRLETLRFTIPEGFTLRQIAEKLAEQQAVDAGAFVKLADETADLPADLPEPIPTAPQVKHRLEGYLFPETYEMKKGSTGADILKRMLAEWDNKLAQLPAGWQDKMKARNLSFHQLVTMASLIEEEVAVDEEKPVVAGVINNRLKAKMKLQIDATVIYALDKPTERVLESDLKIDSPYNTYLHEGLPPGPIASPGLSSLKAALEPADTKYLYYVTKKDGSRQHLFAETLDEHLYNIEASKKQGGAAP